MKVGIVTTWFERGAAYVSKLYMEKLQSAGVEVEIYARGGEEFAKDNLSWNLQNVYWQKENSFISSYIDKKEYESWLKEKEITLVVFNEQHYWQAIIWTKELNILTVAYVDYYRQDTLPLFDLYDAVICNTKRHFSVFENHNNAIYIPWGTDTKLFSPLGKNKKENEVTFFHSCGMSPHRKGTDSLLKAFSNISKENCKLVIHSQINLTDSLPELRDIVDNLIANGKLSIISETVSAPGLYYRGDVYVYPTRLEGIGLTVAEALSSGLPTILPDNAPMNEFSTPWCKKVKIDNFISRADGYYWPENLVNIESLSSAMIHYIKLSRKDLIECKNKVREYTLENFDWNKNSQVLKEELEKVNKTKIPLNLYYLANKMDCKGRPKFTKLYNIYNLIYKIKKII